MMLEAIHRNTRVVVDLSIVKQNIKKQLAKLSPSQELYAVVKANAYGHGMIPVAKAAVEAGAVAAGNVGQVVSTHVIPRPHHDVETLLTK